MARFWIKATYNTRTNELEVDYSGNYEHQDDSNKINALEEASEQFLDIRDKELERLFKEKM